LKIYPTKDRLYIVLDKIEEEKTEGGIYIPDRHNRISRRATIMAVGEGVPYPVGARVLVTSNVGIVIDDPEFYRHGGQDIHRIVTVSEIPSVIEE